MCPWWLNGPKREDRRMCIAQLATPSKLIWTRHHESRYVVPLSEIRARWERIRNVWGHVHDEEHENALAALDVAIGYPTFLRSLRQGGAPQSRSANIDWPTYSATVKVEVEQGQFPIDSEGAWKVTLERDGKSVVLQRPEKAYGSQMWMGTQQRPFRFGVHEIPFTLLKKIFYNLNPGPIDMVTPFRYRFRIRGASLPPIGQAVVLDTANARATLRKPKKEDGAYELEFGVGDILETEMYKLGDSRFLKVTGLVVDNRGLSAINYELLVRQGGGLVAAQENGGPVAGLLRMVDAKNDNLTKIKYDLQKMRALGRSSNHAGSTFGRRARCAGRFI